MTESNDLETRLFRFAVVIPSINTAVEDEYNAMRPSGVSFHVGRLYVEEDDIRSHAAFDDFHRRVWLEMDRTLDSIKTCDPNHLIIGISAESFEGGLDGNTRFQNKFEDMTGLRVTSGAAACAAALNELGARSIAVATPYRSDADDNVRAFFTDAGFVVRKVQRTFDCPTGKSMATMSEAAVAAALRQVDGDDVDAIVQTGTNVRAARVAARLESELGKAVISINTASVWHALRSNGIGERLTGYGSLLASY